MEVLAIIPARMNSSRYPGKPMELINGIPMIELVYRQVIKCKTLSQTIVATCDEEIYEHILSIGGEAIMTKNTHERASDRCAEALIKVEKIKNKKYDIVVMIQGDEPMTHPDMIDQALYPLKRDKEILISNLMSEIKDLNDLYDTNCIKVVFDRNLYALFFSRQPIPSVNLDSSVKIYKQVCVIPFRRDFLIKYNKLPPTPLEKAESVDMMRVLEHGFKLKLALTKFSTQAVDTPEDLKKVENILSQKNT
tara:strand:- start:1567 stop:2316 length:750 start_codon:yes stop_codon:yes gene_type:complete